MLCSWASTRREYFALVPRGLASLGPAAGCHGDPGGGDHLSVGRLRARAGVADSDRAVWGGVVAVTFSGIVNEQTFGFLQHVVTARTVDTWAASVTAPINEELYKGLGLVVIYLMARREMDNVMDGLVYGAMIGLGFQVMENVQYFMVRAAEQGGAADAVVSMFFLRVVLSGLYSHMLFTGFTGLRLRLLRHPERQESGQAARCAGGVRAARLGGAFRVELTLA